MTITFNGQAIQVSEAAGGSLHDFLVERGLKADRIAVERNGAIVPRGEWPQVTLQAGDRLEVVHFVGGGCCPVSE